MKNFKLIIAFLFLSNYLFGQNVINVSGKIETTGNPCLDETCPPGMVWALSVDTATFIFTQNKNWIWSDNPLIIYDVEYSEGDSIKLYGQIFHSQDSVGKDFYKFEITDKEERDTIIGHNGQLTLVFDFHFECGINVFRHPNHYSTSKLSYNNSFDTTTYTYSPLTNFIGTDTVIFLTGCGIPPNYDYIKVVEYLINVSEATKINTITSNTFSIYPNPSSGDIHIKYDNEKAYNFIINNLQGQRIIQGELRQDLVLTLRHGVYIISILDKTRTIYRQKIIIDK